MQFNKYKHTHTTCTVDMRDTDRVAENIVCECVFIKLHMAAQCGPVIHSFYALLHVTQSGLLFVKYFWLEMRVHPATTPLQSMPREKLWGRKRGKWWTGLSPSNTRVKLVARRLAQQIERGIRQTGGTTADYPRSFPIETRQSQHVVVITPLPRSTSNR